MPRPRGARSRNEVGHRVAGGQADYGVLCCYTGTGVAMAANKVAGVRAALCVDAETAQGARRWNDANVLALSLGSPPPRSRARFFALGVPPRMVPAKKRASP